MFATGLREKDVQREQLSQPAPCVVLLTYRSRRRITGAARSHHCSSPDYRNQQPTPKGIFSKWKKRKSCTVERKERFEAFVLLPSERRGLGDERSGGHGTVPTNPERELE